MTTDGEVPQPTDGALEPAPQTLWQPAPALEPTSAPVVPVRTSSDAVVAFILSLVSWAFCPIIFAVVALIFAAKASKAIDQAGGQLQGGGLNLAAKIISWVNIGFWLAILVVGGFIGVVLLLAGAGTQPAHP